MVITFLDKSDARVSYKMQKNREVLYFNQGRLRYTIVRFGASANEFVDFHAHIPPGLEIQPPVHPAAVPAGTPAHGCLLVKVGLAYVII